MLCLLIAIETRRPSHGSGELISERKLAKGYRNTNIYNITEFFSRLTFPRKYSYNPNIITAPKAILLILSWKLLPNDSQNALNGRTAVKISIDKLRQTVLSLMTCSIS